MIRNILVMVVVTAAVAACENESALDMRGHTAESVGSDTVSVGSASSASGPSANPHAPPIELDSKDILARTDVSATADVKHVLIGWKELAPAYRGRMDPRARNRTNADAAKLAQDVLDQLKADPTKIDELVAKDSEDPGSKTGEPYTVDSNSQFVPQFQALALRLKVGEAGIVRTPFGYHVMERVTPPPPDPLESADILARPAAKGPNWVQHILISWKDAPAVKGGQMPPDAARDARTKEQADAMVKDALAKLKGGADMAALMKAMSEDPGSKDDGTPYKVTANAELVPTFKAMGLRLEMGEVGAVKSPFGWHVMKRVAAPPPDPLESADIMKREPPADHVKVKYIVLGWDKAHGQDPRGAKRTRAELDKLVKDTLARLAKGDKFDSVMAELSEDPGAKTATAHDITPSTPRIPDELKDLSLRLKVGENGVVKTEVGMLIVQRTE